MSRIGSDDSLIFGSRPADGLYVTAAQVSSSSALTDALTQVTLRLRIALYGLLTVLLIARSVSGDSPVGWDAIVVLAIVAALGLFGHRLMQHRLRAATAVLEIVGDAAAALACLLLVDVGQAPLGWLVLAIPVVGAGVRHSLMMACIVWITVVVGNMAAELAYRPAVDAGTSLSLGIQQLAAVAVFALPATYLVRHLLGEAERRGVARAAAQDEAQGVANVAVAARRISEAQSTDAVITAALTATDELGFAGAEAWERRADHPWRVAARRSAKPSVAGAVDRWVSQVDVTGEPLVVSTFDDPDTAQTLHLLGAHTMVVLPVVSRRLVLVVASNRKVDDAPMRWLVLLSEHLAVGYNNAVRAEELARRAQGLEHEANHDGLTGLPNRAAVVRRLDHDLGRGAPVSLLFIDLDRFKAVNDDHGHDAGDAVLRATAERMRSVVREDMIVARLGGDEFLVVVPGDDPALAHKVGERIVWAASQPTEFRGAELRIGASVGVSVARPGEQAHNLLQRADQAMYEAKRSTDDAIVVAG